MEMDGYNHCMSIDESLRTEIALALYDIGAIQPGKFKLQGGRTARLYLDLRLLVSFPDTLRLVVRGYEAILKKLRFDLIAAHPLAGLPIGTAVSLSLNVPMIYPRKTARSYGTGKSVEGVWEVGQTAVILDDVIQTGESILQAIVSIKAAGMQVKEAVVLIDREQPTARRLLSNEYQVHALFKITHLLNVLSENGRISHKQHDKVLKSLAAE